MKTWATITPSHYVVTVDDTGNLADGPDRACINHDFDRATRVSPRDGTSALSGLTGGHTAAHDGAGRAHPPTVRGPPRTGPRGGGDAGWHPDRHGRGGWHCPDLGPGQWGAGWYPAERSHRLGPRGG